MTRTKTRRRLPTARYRRVELVRVPQPAALLKQLHQMAVFRLASSVLSARRSNPPGARPESSPASNESQAEAKGAGAWNLKQKSPPVWQLTLFLLSPAEARTRH